MTTALLQARDLRKHFPVGRGLFNRGAAETTIKVKWDRLPTPAPNTSKLLVRDLWRQKDIGVFEGKFETKVASHGVVLVRMSAEK